MNKVPVKFAFILVFCNTGNGVFISCSFTIQKFGNSFAHARPYKKEKILFLGTNCITGNMEHFILNGKIMTLEKNKDTALPIPVMFNTSDEFIIEIPGEQFRKEMVLELSASSTTKDRTKKIQVPLESTVTRFRFIDFPDVEAKDYLLHSCKSSQAIRLSLSIIAR